MNSTTARSPRAAQRPTAASSRPAPATGRCETADCQGIGDDPLDGRLAPVQTWIARIDRQLRVAIVRRFRADPPQVYLWERRPRRELTTHFGPRAGLPQTQMPRRCAACVGHSPCRRADRDPPFAFFWYSNIAPRLGTAGYLWERRPRRELTRVVGRIAIRLGRCTNSH